MNIAMEISYIIINPLNNKIIAPLDHIQASNSHCAQGKVVFSLDNYGLSFHFDTIFE